MKKLYPAIAITTLHFFLTAATHAEEIDLTEKLEVICVRQEDERVLSVVPKDAGCELHYTKAGKSEVIANSRFDLDRCEKVRTQIRIDLAAAGFTCR